ncbi:hypothetical protein ACWIGW_40140 [Nocardia brasiliensis]
MFKKSITATLLATALIGAFSTATASAEPITVRVQCNVYIKDPAAPYPQDRYAGTITGTGRGDDYGSAFNAARERANELARSMGNSGEARDCRQI